LQGGAARLGAAAGACLAKSPGLADNAHKLGAHVRFGTDFSQKLTEIAIS
jgi:hypothetical protein